MSARHNVTVNFRQNEGLLGEERKASSRCSKDATVKEATVSCDTKKKDENCEQVAEEYCIFTRNTGLS